MNNPFDLFHNLWFANLTHVGSSISSVRGSETTGPAQSKCPQVHDGRRVFFFWNDGGVMLSKLEIPGGCRRSPVESRSRLGKCWNLPNSTRKGHHCMLVHHAPPVLFGDKLLGNILWPESCRTMSCKVWNCYQSGFIWLLILELVWILNFVIHWLKLLELGWHFLCVLLRCAEMYLSQESQC